MLGFTYEDFVSLNQANKILMKKIEDDQFLDLMTVKTEVRAVCKEPYRSNHESILLAINSVIYLLVLRPMILVTSDLFICILLETFKFMIYD